MRVEYGGRLGGKTEAERQKAYRAGYAAGLEAASKAVANTVHEDDDRIDRQVRAECLAAISALKDTPDADA